MLNEVQTHGFPFFVRPEDASVAQLLGRLDGRQKGGVTGSDMLDLLRSATDYGQLTAQEWGQIAKWVKNNFNQLGNEAQQVFTRLDEVIQGKGLAPSSSRSVILGGDELKSVMAEIEKLASGAQPDARAAAPLASHRTATSAASVAGDQSAERAIERLTSKRGHITGSDLLRAIFEGTADLDSQAASSELDAFVALRETAGHRFIGSAGEVMAIYEDYAQKARAAGHTGITLADWQAMIADMEAATHSSATLDRSRPPGTPSPTTADLPARSSPEPASGRVAASSGKSPAPRTAGKNDLGTQAAEAANELSALTKQIDDLDPDSPSYRGDLLKIQERLHRAQERLTLLTQMMKALHEMNMAVINNIRV